MNAPKRAIELKLEISADTWQDVRNRLRDYDLHYLHEYGEIPSGTMGSPSVSDIRTVELDPTMTHDRYFEELGKYLEAQKSASAPQAGEE